LHKNQIEGQSSNEKNNSTTRTATTN